MTVLDVGCGGNARGDVNVDLYPNNLRQFIACWNPKLTRNFVLASAEFLPFKDKAFDELICFHCLEHVPNPLMALREFHRVSHIVRLRVPAAYHGDQKTSTHLYTWNETTLFNLLSLVFSKVYVEPRPYRFNGRLTRFLNLLLSFVINKFPKELRGVCS